MRIIRLAIYGVPCLLLALFVAAFINSTQLTTRKKNEFTYGSIGEAAKINPITATDQSSLEVVSLIFEGLLKLDEKLEIAPMLAKSFALSQTGTITFRSPTDAQKALSVIQNASTSWAGWRLTHVSQAGDQLLLTFDLPGLTALESVVALLDPAAVVPMASLRVDASGNARKLLADFRAAHPEVAIDRAWFDYDLAFEITARGSSVEVERKLAEFLKTTGGANAAIHRMDERPFLAEPVLRFQLRDDVHWQDGQPFTSHDCVFTYESLMSEEIASPRKSDFDLIRDVQAPGPYEFIVTYRRPYSSATLSWTMPLLPAHILKNKSKDWWVENFDRNPVGTGPFKFESWKTNEYLRLVRNPHYWNPGPWLDAFVFRTIPDPTVLRLAFETHQLDIYELVLSPWAIKSYRADPRFTVESAPALAYSYIGWNMRREMFRDVRVRTAFAHAVNVPDMIEYVNYGNGTQSTGIFVPEFWFADATIKPIAYDPERAKQLLDEAGWKPGPDGIRMKDGQRLSFTIITNQGNDIRKDIATLVQDDLRRVGAEARVEIYEWAVFIERFINKHEFDADVLAWSTPPDWDVFQVWHSSQTGIDQLNHVGYESAEADRLITELRQEYDRDKVKKLASQLQRRIYEDQPVLFMNAPREPLAIWKNSIRIRRKTDHGWIDTPFEIVPSAWYYFVDGFYRPEYANLLPKVGDLEVK